MFHYPDLFLADDPAALLGEDGTHHVSNPRHLPGSRAVPVYHTQGSGSPPTEGCDLLRLVSL